MKIKYRMSLPMRANESVVTLAQRDQISHDLTVSTQTAL